MMRYLKYLADKDYALDRGMIPLGSCTMKLNAATEMEAVTWPEFADIHPFAPLSDVGGYLALIEQLQDWLAEVTGYDAVSLQPNAGSQGELAGLLAIRGYHQADGRCAAHGLPHPLERPRHQRGIARCWPACGSSSWPATSSATSTSTTCTPRSPSTPTRSPRS